MPANSPAHPDKQQLMAFGLGKLDPPHTVEIEAHLNECSTCCDTLLSLQDDTFIGLVRQAAQLPADESDGSTATPTVSLPGQSASMAEMVPRELADHPRYRVLKLAGKGGMGLVFTAEHKLMGRTVALKVINQQLISNEEAVERFRREVQAAARLTHPNIVTAYDAEQAGDVHFLVMEYVDGVNLSEVIGQGGPLEIGLACDYVRQIADGLQHAHAKGMVHRDIKPHNLMVNSSGQVKILDFGLATLAMSAGEETKVLPARRDDASYVTRLGTMMGTPDFISPEQAGDCRAADIRSDIYSLGCTFYYLLTGRAPFNTGTALERVKSHANSEPTPIETIRRDIPNQLAMIVRRMMAKDPAQRYQSPAEIADALASFAADTNEKSPAKVAPQLQAIGRRKRPLTKLLVGAAFAGALAIVGAIFFAELQKTTVRFEVNDPSLSISFGADSIAVKDADREFTIAPKSEQRFTIKKDGTELETDTFTLNKGQKIALRIDVVKGRVRVTPSDGSVVVGQAEDPVQSVDVWVERLKELREHNQTAFVIGPGILYIDPDKALEAVQKAWPQITIPEVKTGILKVFAFSKPLSPKKHPRVLQVLDLGMRDADPEIRAYAASYVEEYSGINFSSDDKAYAAWYEQNGQKPLREIEQGKAAKVAEVSLSLLGNLESAMHKGDVGEVQQLAAKLGESRSPAAIPTLIGVIDADNSYDTVYGVGYFGLNKITGVEYSPYHDGAWWRRWWDTNKSRYPKDVQDRPIPNFPKTAHGKTYKPFPEDMDTLAGKLANFSQLENNGPVTYFDWANQVAAHKDPAAIPFMIGVIEADNTYNTIYGVGYYGLSKLTGVKYSESHDGAWWRNWWAENKSKYSQEVQQLEIPNVRAQLAAVKKNAKAAEDPAKDVADIPVKDLRAGGNKNMRYFLIGPRKDVEAPKSGFKVLVVMPGGDGGADFNPFIRRIYQNALNDEYLIVEPVAFKWRPNQEIVWPTRTNKVDGQRFATEDFVETIIRDVETKHKIDKKAIYTLSWSSSGPAAYAIALAKDTPVTGSYIAMSVFHPTSLPPLASARGRAYYIEHSPDDQVCPFDQAKQAEESLKKEGANVQFNIYDGGHGWRGDVFGRIRTGVKWLEQQSAANK
jgi:serine/threonine protein kinase/predicted esterase